MALHPCLGFVHLEISIHRVVPDLPYVDIFHYTVSKNAHLLVSLPISAEESLSYWEAIKLAMADQLFQNSHLPWKHELLSYHRHPVSPLLWSDKLTLFISQNGRWEVLGWEVHKVFYFLSQKLSWKSTKASHWHSQACSYRSYQELEGQGSPGSEDPSPSSRGQAQPVLWPPVWEAFQPHR